MPRLFSRFKRGLENHKDKPVRVLVIDDENNIRMMIRMALQHVGHTVETASDGPEGLNKFGDG